MPVRLLFAVVSVGLLGFAPAPLPRKERRPDPQADLRGEWVLVRLCDGAGDAPLGELAKHRVRITRDTIAFGPDDLPMQMALDPGASPPSVTWSINRNVLFVGSYRLAGNELTLVFAASRRLEDRPKDFDGTPPYRYVMRRISR